jgi:hypothetical protein
MAAPLRQVVLSVGRPSQHRCVGRIDPEVPVEVLDNGDWIKGSAHYRQQLPDEWWYHVRVYDPHGYVRLLFVRYPEYVRKQSSDR